MVTESIALIRGSNGSSLDESVRKIEVLDEQVTIRTIKERGPLGGAEVVFRRVGRNAALVEAVRLGIRALASDAAGSTDSDLNVGPVEHPQYAGPISEVLIRGGAL